ncbi:MAG: DUF4292 domain-containing protein [Bacteroidia bacterium]|nr:DUF4292 domain-containing protein [Bacteroidia bacterium]
MNIHLKNNLFFILFFIPLFFLNYHCKGKKKSQRKKDVVIISDSLQMQNCKVPSLKTSELIQKMNAAELTFKTLTIKAQCSFTLDENAEDVDLKIRIIKDSLIWVHIDYLSIDIARILITNDSLKFINYRQKQYLSEPIDLLSKLLNTEVDLTLLQAALVGNSAEFYSDDDKIRSFTDKESCIYHLSTLKKRKLRKVEEGKKELNKILQNITIQPENFKILTNVFQEPEQNRSFIAEYSDFTMSDSIFAPRRVDIRLQVGKKVDVKLKYVRMEKNANTPISFKIPPKYERVVVRKD